ncbi:YbhB/YbcL family Raf kinase inhibitor-like protein [Curtobacterium sp. MCBA15_013]|uniref:YbhB/YbcL family Raf kinase inhibitor-like protein n=1 Tax=Curtobacterium sp. MCBA15_013 TaxID=1898739 RepID=UPI0034A0C718
MQRSRVLGIRGGQGRSPEWPWFDAPKLTKRYVVTLFDRDVTSDSGSWHWAVRDIPASPTQLPAGAVVPDSSDLPTGAVQLPGDAGNPRYIGVPRPPAPWHTTTTSQSGPSTLKRLTVPTAHPPRLSNAMGPPTSDEPGSCRSQPSSSFPYHRDEPLLRGSRGSS